MSPWLRLIKYKLSLAVTLTGVAGYLICVDTPGLEMIFLALGVFLLASGASALNQVQERSLDSLMNRTSNRPLPSGSLAKKPALAISLILIICGSLSLLLSGWLPFLLGLSNILFYNLLYTRLKRVSYLAIIPGALVGALPPIIGWTAAGGNPFSPTILYLALLIFMWQIPHFWLLIIKYHREYEKAGFKTVLKIFDEIQVRRLVFIWIAVSTMFAMTWFYFGIDINIVFAYIILISNILFILCFYWLLFHSNKEISTAFVLSNAFISTIFLLLALGSLL